MKLNQEFFAIKLYEMERQYAKLQSRLRICGQEDRAKIREELQRADDEYREQNLVSQQSIEASRSRAVKELAQAQLTYNRRVEALLQGPLAEYLHSEKSSAQEDRAEAATLYAEYAIDFATQSMRYALVAALNAVDLQLDTQDSKGA